MFLSVFGLLSSVFKDSQGEKILGIFFEVTARMVCKKYFLRDVIQGGVCLVTCPVLGTPQLHHINRLELIFDF